MRRSLLLAALVLSACQPRSADETPAVDAPSADTPAERLAAGARLTVRDAVAPPAPAGGTSAVFLTLVGGAEADTLIGARCAGAAATEVHESFETADGLRAMRPVENGLAVPAGATVALAPGGYHVMLVDLSAPLAEGDTLGLVLTFARAGTVAVQAVVRPLSALPMTADR